MRPNYRDNEDGDCPACLLAGRDVPALVAELGETQRQLAALRLKYAHALDADHWMRQTKQIRALMDEVLGDVPSGETTFSAVQRYVARSGLPPVPP